MSMNLMSGSTEIPVRVADIVQVSERVKRFRFRAGCGWLDAGIFCGRACCRVDEYRVAPGA